MDADFAAQVKASDAAVPTGERRVALALHGMAAADRDWMLQQLGAERRTVIEGLLVELRELGVVAPPPLLVESLVDEDEVRASSGSGTGMPAREALRQLPAEVLHQVLRGEPDRLIEDVLRLGPFAEQVELTRLLRGSGRRIEPPMAETMEAATRKAELLVEAVLRRAADCAPVKPVAQLAVAELPARNWVQRLLQRRARP